MDGGRQGNKRRVGAARRRSRGHGPARLDGTRPRATVADKVMKSGETAGQGNGPSTRRPHGKRSAQARSWKPGRRRQPSGVRGRWKPDRGETPQGVRCAARQRDRPSPRWPGTPSLQSRRINRIRASTGKASRICRECGLADPAQPGRRCSGVPSLRGGDSPQGFPLEGKPKARRHRARWARCEGRPATPQGRVRQRSAQPAAHRAHRRSTASRRETTDRARWAGPARRAPSPARPS